MEGNERDFLLYRSDLPVHPRVWIFLGVLYCILGAAQVVAAGLWRWWFGLAVGVAVLKTGSSLVGIGLSSGRPAPLPPGAGLWQRLWHTGNSLVLWGSAKFQRLFWALRWPLYGLGAFVALLLLIHWKSPDPWVPAFPGGCPLEKSMGCSRVAGKDAHAARDLQPVRLAAPLNETQAAVEAWIGAQSGGRVLHSRPGFVHARVVSLLFGFADDFFVQLRCDKDSRTVIETQGQLRIGRSDLGVNGRRNKRFLTAMQGSVLLPQGECHVGGSSRDNGA